MSSKAVAWILLAAVALGGILLLNYWGSYQPLSTLAYAGMAAALCGLANIVIPFRFLGVRKRAVGTLVFASGLAMALAALFWPAPAIRVAQPKTILDAIMPEYQFNERHSTRIHAGTAQVMEAIRQSTWSDMKSLNTLLRIRGAVLRTPDRDTSGFSKDNRMLDGFAQSGYVFGGSEHEIVMAGGANMKAKGPIRAHTLKEFADYRDPGAFKMAFDFYAEDAGGGWSALTAETRVAVQEDSSRGPGIYWRLMVPGSGLLRREWLEGIKRRAEAVPAQRP